MNRLIASLVVDSGAKQYEAAALLRHADVMTTNPFCARGHTWEQGYGKGWAK